MNNVSLSASISGVIWVMIAALWVSPAAAAQDQTSPAPSPPSFAKEALSDAWWTGPMLAPSAQTLPRGHVLVEPYLYNVIQYGSYDGRGALKQAAHTNDIGSLTYIIYGLTDRISVGAIPTAGYNTAGGSPGSGVELGDTSVLAQYRLTQYQMGRWVPTTSIAVQETFPTGKYENLGLYPNSGIGGGVYSTKVSLYTQTFAWMPNGRILRLRLNFSNTFSGSANVEGVSVYGTDRAFRGSVKPGDSISIDAAGEYSLTRNWVFASDLVYGYGADTRLNGTNGLIDLGDDHSFAFAPAIEYNWTANAGLLVGIRVLAAGRNTAASVTPAIAINLVR